jgi:hypothetical protein
MRSGVAAAACTALVAFGGLAPAGAKPFRIAKRLKAMPVLVSPERYVTVK